MNLKISRAEAQQRIQEFFKSISSKTPEEIKKIKRLAMNKKISLKNYRKLFCKKCLTPYSGNEKIRIKRGIKSVECGKCGFIGRWRI